MAKTKPWQNSSGYNDPTAYAATQPTDEEVQVTKLVQALRAVAELSGFSITNRIELYCRKSGKHYR